MKRVFLAALAVSIAFAICSCGETSETYDVKGISITLPSGWSVADISDYATTVENKEDAEALKTFLHTSDEGLLEEKVIDNTALPEWLCLYCYDIAGTGNAGDIATIKENIKDNEEDNLTKLEEIDIDSVKGIWRAYEDGKYMSNAIYFIANGYQYSLEFNSENGNMDQYVKTVIDGIKIKEDTSQLAASIGDIKFTLKGVWKEDRDSADDRDEEEREGQIDTVVYNYSDGFTNVEFDQFEDGILTDFDTFIDNCKNDSDNEFIDSETYEADGIGKMAIVYQSDVDDEGPLYGSTIIFKYNGSGYIGMIYTDTEDKMNDFTKQFKDTVTKAN